ncbi:TetR/AcrR family transcriptional regulator [Nonomuraea sp. NPDC000554]|uniref:TetR/AcrR family transcriptional regulator n=1 Tax=Nonomuraea sp. NPDC000554 TaxID=3154259 RepID=UPI00332902CD
MRETGAKGRRKSAPTKGDLRERAILDAAEHQLGAAGPDSMTVEMIASAAGISRAAFYFYFASKNDVLAALVERTVSVLRADIDAADAVGPPPEALRRGVERTARMWREHGSVMRAAVELAPTVPAIGEQWRAAVAAIADITRRIAERAGLPADDSPIGARAITTTLTWMTERSFYETSRTSGSLEATAETLTHLWLTAIRGSGR